MPIDLNRGVSTRRHQDGCWIHMYKDQPGVYYTESGDGLVDMERAAQAGFDVMDHAKAKRRAEILEEQQVEIAKRVEEEFSGKVEKAESEIEKDFAERIENEEKGTKRPFARASSRTPKKEKEGL